MRAIIGERYGLPSEVLRLRDVEPPAVAEDRVLVRVHAASLNAMDWHLIMGRPILARATTGLTKPKDPRTGSDFAGVVEAVGAGVTGFVPGDAVFGSTSGALGELVAPRAAGLAHKPASLSLEQAAALPVAGATALQAIRTHARLAAGETVLVLGAGGGVGSFAVQIAAADGGRVTAVTGPASVDAVKGLGAERVVNRDAEDILTGRERFDVVLDAGGFASSGALLRLLTPSGRAVVVGAGASSSLGLVAGMAAAGIRGRLAGRPIVNFIATMNRESLDALAALADAGRLEPLLGRTIALADVPSALDEMVSGGTRGKTVVRVAG
ncbi:MAG: NAD(P)-dependent alcohol dehydrogenase [Chloroflexota bacterium]